MDRFLIKGGGPSSKTVPNTKTSTTTTTTSTITTTASNTKTAVASTRKCLATTSQAITTCTPHNPRIAEPGPSSRCRSESESESEEKENASEPPAKKPKASYMYSFNEKWLSMEQYSKWLVKKIKENSDSAFCKVCDTNVLTHKSALDKHMSSIKHQINSKTIEKIKPIEKLLAPKPDDHFVRRAEIKICAFLTEHNLPISLADDLVPFLSNILPDSNIAKKIKLGRTKTTNMITRLLAPAFTNDLINKIKEPGNFFSIIMDETTDISPKKQCALAIIFYNNDTNSVETRFLDLYEVVSGKGEDLSGALINWLKLHSIPLTNFIGFASDTTNSMVGEHNSVFSHLKQQIPEIACVKCSCHLIHLVASKACLKLPRSVEDMLKNIASHFSRSSKRYLKLEEFQKFFEVECHKILSPANTRWLSLKACVDRILEQYEVLKEYFRVEVFEDPSKTTESILETLNNKIVKIYLEFMSYTLELLNDFNKLFQSEKPLLHRLQPEVEELIRIIACNYMQFNYAKTTNALIIDHANPRHFLPIEQIYLGVLAQESVNELKNSDRTPSTSAEIMNLRRNCMAFYIEVINQIKQRFEFQDPLFEIVKALEPKYAQAFEIKDLTQILKRFPVLKDFVTEQSLHTEWRQHAFLDHKTIGLKLDLDSEEYWAQIFNIKRMGQEPMFPNLKKAMSLLLVLPFSNACVERVFSQLKLIKTDQRNKLNTSTISALMTVKQHIPDSIQYEPPKSLITSNVKLY